MTRQGDGLSLLTVLGLLQEIVRALEDATFWRNK